MRGCRMNAAVPCAMHYHHITYMAWLHGTAIRICTPCTLQIGTLLPMRPCTGGGHLTPSPAHWADADADAHLHACMKGPGEGPVWPWDDASPSDRLSLRLGLHVRFFAQARRATEMRLRMRPTPTASRA